MSIARFCVPLLCCFKIKKKNVQNFFLTKYVFIIFRWSIYFFSGPSTNLVESSNRTEYFRTCEKGWGRWFWKLWLLCWPSLKRRDSPQRGANSGLKGLNARFIFLKREGGGDKECVRQLAKFGLTLSVFDFWQHVSTDWEGFLMVG